MHKISKIEINYASFFQESASATRFFSSNYRQIFLF
jgi:hypothetical protein